MTDLTTDVPKSEPALTPYEQLTPAMRHVVDALAEGVEPSPEMLAALSPRERGEVRQLSRTARLTYLSLHQPPLSAESEAQALRRAQSALAARGGRNAATPKPEPGGLRGLLRRLRGGRREGEEETG